MPVHYMDSLAQQPACRQMTQNSTCLESMLWTLSSEWTVRMEWHSSPMHGVKPPGITKQHLCRDVVGEVLGLWASCFYTTSPKNCETLRILL